MSAALSTLSSTDHPRSGVAVGAREPIDLAIRALRASETWKRAALAAGIPEERVHLQANTRHSAAKAAVGRGEQLALVSALLGHSNLETARKHYVEIDDETLRPLVQ